VKPLPSFLVASVLVCACVSTNAALIDPSVHLARTCPSAIKLFTTPDRVGQPYREVALLNAKGESNWQELYAVSSPLAQLQLSLVGGDTLLDPFRRE
jgi:hypothetical protein